MIRQPNNSSSLTILARIGIVVVALTAVFLVTLPLTSAGSAPSTSQSLPGSARSPFDWHLRIDGKAQSITNSSGALAITPPGWSCQYSVDPLTTEGETQQQWGSLACNHDATGKALDTLVLCRVISAKDTDCAGGNLQVGIGTKAHRVELSCGSKNRRCTRPPLQLGEPSQAGGLGMRGASTSQEAIKKEPSNPNRFLWKLQVDDPGRTSKRLAITKKQGAIEHGVSGWKCDYEIEGGDDANYGYYEVATVICQPPTGESFSVNVPCAIIPSEPHYCNVASLRFKDNDENVRALSMNCKDEGNPGCWK